MKKIIRLTESDLTKLVKRVVTEQKDLLLEFAAPQGLIQTIKTPIDKLQILGCKNEPCDSILWVKGDGGTFKYKVEIKTAAGPTGLKYRDFKKIPNGYQFIGYPTNILVRGGAALGANESDTKITTRDYAKKTNYIKCQDNPNAKLSIKDSSNKVILPPTPFVWNQKQNSYCITYNIPAPGKYKETLITQNKPESNYGTSELIVYFSDNDIKKMQQSLIENNGEVGSFKQANGTVVLTFQP